MVAHRQNRHFPAAACMAVLLLACGAEDPIAASQNQEIVEGSFASSFPSAALIDVELDGGTGDCSGTVIAPKVVLTAGHCIYGFNAWTVTVPYADNQSSRTTRYELLDWATPPETPRPDMHDVGVLLLDDPIVLETYPTLIDEPLRNKTKIRYIGRVRNGVTSTTDLYIGDPMKARHGKDVGWPFTYRSDTDSEKGDSGGPVIVHGKDVTIVAGINSGGNDDIQLSTRVELVHDWITGHVDAAASE
ncbi:trypsin-like serine protease [Endomicrobium sp. AH-315-J14]|nr:trypsin-like serine protease [Endomicrobium sp. AH-315-J14]